MMEAGGIFDLLRNGGSGAAALLFWLYLRADKERMRYRDNYEKTLTELPKVAAAIEGLRDDLQKISRDSRSKTSRG